MHSTPALVPALPDQVSAPAPAPNGPRRRVEICVAGGVGAAPTALAALDAALRHIGVGDYNLIPLSSVLPPGSVVTTSRGRVDPPGGWGDRLYVVAAEARSEVSGSEAWAGIGWARDPRTGAGLLVEHNGHREDEVAAEIDATLAAMRQGRGAIGGRLTDQRMVTAGITCTGLPVCAVVVAVFAAEPW